MAHRFERTGAGVLIVTALVLWSSEAQQVPSDSVMQLNICMNDSNREIVRDIILQALNEALKKHVEQMFSVWMKDSYGQPARARVGLHGGITAYLQARQNTEQWSPPECQQ